MLFSIIASVAISIGELNIKQSDGWFYIKVR